MFLQQIRGTDNYMFFSKHLSIPNELLQYQLCPKSSQLKLFHLAATILLNMPPKKLQYAQRA